MSRREIVKCFIGNLDGKNQGLVIASSQKKAAKIAGTSLYDFSRYWSSVLVWPKQPLKPYTLYVKAYDSRDSWRQT